MKKLSKTKKTNRTIFKTTTIFFTVALLFLGLSKVASAAYTGSSPTWTTTPDYDSVSGCISKATAGDTINVAQGTETWNSQLVINKGIYLIGAGIGKTVITSNYNNTGYTGLIVYRPTNYAADEPFRLSGFTIDGDFKCGCVHIVNQHTTPITKVRIDHNRFTKGYQLYVIIDGLIFGVADNNTIDWVRHMDSDCLDHFGLGGNPAGIDSWRYTTFAVGSANNWYWEDNTINWDHSSGGASGDVFDCCHGARYAARYNTINDVSTCSLGATNLSPVFNNHGNQNAGEYSSMGAEIYRNTVNTNQYTNRMISHRGGQMIAFDNIATGSAVAWSPDVVREDANGCDYSCSVPVNQIDGTPQHPHDSYMWGDRYHGTTKLTYSIDMTLNYNSGCGPGEPYRVVPQEDKDVWLEKSSFNGTTGMGVGLLSARPSTCTEGVAYWATDQGDWNKSGSGVQGVLYKCTSQDNWEVYYTPLHYPHPLRVPEFPKDLRVISK
jgi:hypothetical protein